MLKKIILIILTLTLLSVAVIYVYIGMPTSTGEFKCEIQNLLSDGTYGYAWRNYHWPDTDNKEYYCSSWAN